MDTDKHGCRKGTIYMKDSRGREKYNFTQMGKDF